MIMHKIDITLNYELPHKQNARQLQNSSTISVSLSLLFPSLMHFLSSYESS